MNLKLDDNLHSSKKFNAIIISSVSIFAVQNLLFLITFEINFPYSVDFSDQFIPVFNFLTTGEFTLFLNKGVHIIFFPKLISIPVLYLTNFDITILYYLQWIVVSFSVYIFYLILKQTDKKIIWTIIPISAFLYSPLSSSGYWALSLLPWLFAMLGIILTIYILNIKKIKPLTFLLALIFSIFSTLSIVVGVTTWISGLLLTIKNSHNSKFYNKKWIIFWIMSLITMGLIYYSLTSEDSDQYYFEMIFSSSGLSFIANFLASSFRLKFDFLITTVGIISLLFSIYFLFAFTKKHYIKKFFPWFMLLLVGISGALIATIGRAHLLETHFGNEPYYIPISQLFQIGLLVLSAKLFYDFRNYDTNKKIFSYLFIILIITQLFLLIPSYYSGWQRGEYYYEEKNEFLSCFTSSPSLSCLNTYNPDHNEFLTMINFLIENKFSIFDDPNFIKENQINIENFEFENHKISKHYGKIIKINEQSIDYNSKLIINTPSLDITGWIITPSDEIPDSVYLLIDNEPIVTLNQYNEEIQIKESNPYSTWRTFLMAGYIEPGCHEISLLAIKDDQKFILESSFELCK